MTVPWSVTRTPATWILLPPVVLAGIVSAALLAIAAFFAPRTTAAVLPIILGHAAVSVWFVLRWADPVERRPTWLVVAAISWGGGIAGLVAMGGNHFLDAVLGQAISPGFATTWGAALTAPTAEEVGKAAGVVMVLLVARPYLTTAWSGAIYGALVGVGFTAMEDLTYAAMAGDQALPDDVEAGVGTTVLRLLVLGVVGHSLFTGLAGAGIAYAWLRHGDPPGRRLAVLAGTFSGAWLLHFTVNSPIGSAVADAVDGLPGVVPWAAFMLVLVVPAVPALWWLARLRRHDLAVVLGRTARLPAQVRQGEIEVLVRSRLRRGAEQAARRSCGAAAGPAAGAAAASAVRRLHHAQRQLAAALSRPYRGYPPVGPAGELVPPALRWSTEVDAARAALASLPGAALASLPGAAVVATPAGCAGTAPAHVLTDPAAGTAGVPVSGHAAADAAVRGDGAGPGAGSPGGRGAWWVAGVLAAAAVLSLMWWPATAAVVTVTALVILRTRGSSPRAPTATAVLAAAFSAYVWLLGTVAAMVGW